MMNFKIIILACIFGLVCFSACEKDKVEPTLTPAQTTTTTTTTNTNGQGNNNAPNQITNIVITPNYGKFVAIINNSITYSAKAYNRSGNEITANFIWTTEDNSIASSNTSGTVTGLGLGQTFIQASADGVQSNRSELFVVNDCIQLYPPPISSPEILGFPASISLNVGDTYEWNDYIESKRCLVPMYAFKCIADPSVAALTTTGLRTLTGLAPGRTVVTLSFHHIRKYVLVEVNP